MLYAKSYEQENSVMNWWEDEKTSSPAVAAYQGNFQARAEAGYRKALSDSFLKERYAYQLLLLAYYADDAEAMETYFMRHFKDEQGALADWARFHFAGQWNGEGRYTIEMANALRAAPEKAIAAYLRTAKRINPEDYTSALRNNAERSNLYALAALKQKGKALKFLQEAYRLAPSNPLVALLIVREINKLEDWLMSNPLTGLGPAISSYPMPDWDAEDYAQTVKRLREENMAKDRAYLKQLRLFLSSYQPQDTRLGAIFRGQTALLDEDFRTALKETASLTEGKEGAGLQVRIIRYLALLQEGNLKDEKVKEELAEHLLALDASLPKQDPEKFDFYSGSNYNILPALNRIASQRYAAAGDTATAYFLHNRSLELINGDTWSSETYQMIDFLDRDITPKIIDDVINIKDRATTNSAFDRLIKSTRAATRDELYNLAGTLALRRNELELAATYFSKITSPQNGSEDSYPLVSPLADMLGTELNNTVISKEMLVRQLLVLEELSQQGGDRGAAACLALAQAWYNMSDFGPAWSMLSYGKSSIKPTEPIAWPGGLAHAGVPHNQADFNLIHRSSRSEEYFACAEASAKDQQLMAEIDLSRRILTYRITEQKVMAGSWSWLNEDERALLANNYREIMSPFVRNYGRTNYAIKVAAQCSSLQF